MSVFFIVLLPYVIKLVKYIVSRVLEGSGVFFTGVPLHETYIINPEPGLLRLSAVHSDVLIICQRSDVGS